MRSYSTETCLIYLNDYLKEEIDKGNYCGMAILNLQKAFDTLKHIILDKWMSSYLTSRVQKVAINGTV